MKPIRRVSYVFLCLTPFLSIALGGVRALRVPGVYQAIGVACFAAIAVTVWVLSAGRSEPPRKIADCSAGQGYFLSRHLRSLRFAGSASARLGWRPPAENQMRYLVLIVMASAVAGGFVVLKEALSGAGERCYSTLGFAAIMLSCPLYLIWNSFEFAAVFGKIHAGAVPAAIVSLSDMGDLLLFLAGSLTYLATAAFAASLGRVQWLGRGAQRAYIIVNGVALLFLVIRGLQFPDPKALSTPWYINLGFVVGIPAVPFIMPFLLGVVLLRRAGEEQP